METPADWAQAVASLVDDIYPLFLALTAATFLDLHMGGPNAIPAVVGLVAAVLYCVAKLVMMGVAMTWQVRYTPSPREDAVSLFLFIGIALAILVGVTYGYWRVALPATDSGTVLAALIVGFLVRRQVSYEFSVNETEILDG